jgi:magnesium-transporting ATPase (P-type)
MKPIDPLKEFSEIHWRLLEQSICCNIPAHLSATDISMADLMKRASTNMEDIKKKHNVLDSYDGKIRFPFSSSRKRMSTIIENATGNGGYDKRLLIKGASEMILKCCDKYVDESGNTVPLDDNTVSQVKAIIH